MNKSILIVVLFALVLISCNKEEGEGGNSVITGKVFSKVYNNSLTQMIDSYYKPDVDVYLVYGDNETYNDDFKTDRDGTFRFEYLRKGNYKIFAYSVDNTGASGSGITPVIIEVNVGSSNEVVSVEDLVISEKMDYDDGTSTITGKLRVDAYNRQRTTILGSHYKADWDVFISYGSDRSYFENVKTYFDGSFQFTNLVKGDYIIYAMSDNMNTSNSQDIIVADTITITQGFQNIVMDELVVSEAIDYNDGTSSITGSIYVLDWNAERTSMIASYFGADEDVYITFGNDPFYFDDVKTHHDGTYQFNNLVKGKYTIYALSDPFARQLVPVSVSVEITEENQHIVLDSIKIVK